MHSTGERWRLGHRPALDGLRGIAVLLVVAYHAGVPFFAHGGGSVGVTVFFTLSGFLITSLLLEEFGRSSRVDMGRFYWRRALRLFPAVAVYVTVMSAVGLAFGRNVADWRDLPKILLYIYNWSAASGHPPAPGMAHLWSLSVEEQFYLVWPALLLLGCRFLSARIMLLLTLVGAAASMLARVELYGGTDAGAWRVYYGSDTRVDALLIGCVVALVASRRGLPNGRPVLAVAALGGIIATVAWDGPLRLVVTPTVVPLLTVAVIAFGSTARWLSPRWLTLVGRRSYGLYLWHVPPVVLLLPHSPLPAVVGVPLAFAASWALTCLSWRFVEQPFLRLKDGLQVASRPEASRPLPTPRRRVDALPGREAEPVVAGV